MFVVYCLSMLMLISSTLKSHAETVMMSDKTGSVGSHKTSTSDTIVAFSVARKSTFSPVSISIIPMDHVFYNDGGYFNMTTSLFTAPVSGVYAFYFGACSVPGKKLQLYLYIRDKDKNIQTATTYNYNTGGYNHASGSVYKKMEMGEQAALWSGGGHAINGHDPPSAFFNGHLMKATSISQ